MLNDMLNLNQSAWEIFYNFSGSAKI